MNKILFNGLLYEKGGAGISVYTKNLIEQFAANTEYPIDVLVRKEHQTGYEKNEKLFFADKAIKSSKARILYEQVWGVKQYNTYDVVHFPDYAASLTSNTKKIITIHDMAMFTMKDFYTKKQIAVKQFLLKAAVKQAEGIICDSEYAKRELNKYFPDIKEDWVEVVYPGISQPFVVRETKSTDPLKLLHINKPYMLFVGTIAPSKNLIHLIQAFNLIRHKGYDIQLVICGKKGWMYENVFAERNGSKYKEDIIFTDYVSIDVLEVLYKEAMLFISTSLYEGFGFPPLEAMIRQVPTVVSDLAIFKETCKEAACYFNPKDIESIADTVIKVISDSVLQVRLKVLGCERAQLFTWQRTADQINAFYQRILLKD